MKRFYLLFSFLIFLSADSDGQRYLEEVFTDVMRIDTIPYGQNTTILPLLVPGGTPLKRPLFLNLYMPEGDTETERPLIMMYHTGNFLPRLINGNNNGQLDDIYVVALAERLARMGYVVAMVDYRKGWNPISDDQDVRTNTLINAAYRGVQDANTCSRFFRKTIEDFGNPYGLDADQFVAWGIGTGGYISYAAGALDNYLDVVLPKFIGADINGDGMPDPMVIDFINGDPQATTVGINPLTGDTLCFPNHIEKDYSDELQLCVNMGGAMGDISWLDAEDPPMISFHVPTDPFAPYDEGTVIVPTTEDPVVDVVGSYAIAQQAEALGTNSVWNTSTFNDVYSDAANSRNDGFEGLFPMPRQDWDLTDDGVDNPTAVEASPWEYWDVTQWSTAPFGQATLDGPGEPCDGIPMEFCNWHIAQSGSNPDMSIEKAMMYQDSILGYFAPRACVALQLDCASLFTSTEDIISDVNLTISPNPTDDYVMISTDGQEILSLDLTDLQGKKVLSVSSVNASMYELEGLSELSGMHVLTIRFEEGIVTRKLLLD